MVLASLNLIPVWISYEYDPCDQAKARELSIRASTGSYEKAAGEDDASIALGITGYKGRVHVHFGSQVTSGFEDAKQLAALMDKHILGGYRLFPVHYLAYAQWDERDEALAVPPLEQQFAADELQQAQLEWQRRLDACPAEQRPWLIRQYATPVRNQYRIKAGLPL